MLSQFDRYFIVSSRREVVWVTLLVLIFGAINFVCATHTPTVFADEPGYTDPAANYHLGNGFTSTMWAQDRHDFWTGNVALYEILLALFFKVFGFGFFQARIVNTVLAGLAAGMIWLALKRTEIIKTASYRILSVLLVLSGSVSTLTIRTIRPDTTMLVVCAGVFLAWTIRSEKLRMMWVFLVSSLLLMAGLAMLPYSILMLAICMIVLGAHVFRTIVVSLVGVFFGGVWLVLFYGFFSSVRTFVDIVLPFTIIQTGGASFETKLRVKFFGDSIDSPDTIFTSFFGNPIELVNPKTLFDYSAALLFLVILVLAFVSRSNLKVPEKQVILFAFLMVLIVPPTLHIMGHYRAMYRWMTYMPLCVLAPCLAESVLSKVKNTMLRHGLIGAFLMAILLGVPLRTAFAFSGWSERSTGPIDAAAKRVVNRSDVMVGNLKTYFAIMPLAKTVFLFGLPARGRFDMIQDLPKSEITLLCLKPEEVEEVTRQVGGIWRQISSGNADQENDLTNTRYSVNFYRRVESVNGN